MADEARLTFVIEEPAATVAAGPAAARPSGDDWQPWMGRYRELNNLAEGSVVGYRLSPAEQAELAELTKKFNEYVYGPTGVPAAAPAATATTTFRSPSAAPPGWTVPGSRQPSPPIGIYKPPPGGAGGGPPAPPAGPNGLPSGWGDVYQRARAGTANAVASWVADGKAATKRRAGRAWRRQFESWRAAEDDKRTAFDTATAHFGRGKRGMLGAAVGGYRAAAAGGSILGGAASGAMAAVGGGPVGLAMAAKEIINSLGDSAAGGIKALGESAQKIAGNDHLGLFKDAVTGAGKVMDAVSPVTGAAFKVAAAGAVAFAETANAFAARGRELSGYNGSLASATATADVRSLRADIREANAIGPDVARLIDAQSRADTAFRSLIEPAKQAIAKFLAGGFEKIADRLEAMVMVIERTEEARQNVGNWVQQNSGKLDLALGTMGSPLLILTKRLMQYLGSQENAPVPPSDELIQKWLNAADGMGAESYIPAGAPVTRPPGQPGGFGQPWGPGGLDLPAFGR